jgi:hypothetical protein
MTTLTLQPDATVGIDAYINAGTPTGNYGVTTTMNVGGSGVAAAARGLLMFDISSLPVGATINSAILTLYCESEINTTNRTVGVHRALTQWVEGVGNNATPGAGVDGSTWNLRNHNGSVAWAGGAGGASGSDWTASATDSEVITGPSTAFDFDVLIDVQAWYDGSASNFGWWLINTSEGTNTIKRFTSSDGATADNRPKLVIDYTEAGGDQVARTLEIGGQFGFLLLPTGGAGMVTL